MLCKKDFNIFGLNACAAEMKRYKNLKQIRKVIRDIYFCMLTLFTKDKTKAKLVSKLCSITEN